MTIEDPDGAAQDAPPAPREQPSIQRVLEVADIMAGLVGGWSTASSEARARDIAAYFDVPTQSQPSLAHEALIALVQKWRAEAAIHAGAAGDEADIAHGKGLCADELEAALKGAQ